MKKLAEDLKRYGTSGLAILLWLTVVSAFLVANSIIHLFSAASESILVLALLARLIAVFLVLVVTLAALPARGCARKSATPEPIGVPASAAVQP